jgi:hypothetical protein
MRRKLVILRLSRDSACVGPFLPSAMTVPRASYFRSAFSVSSPFRMSRRARLTTPELRPAKRPRGDARPLTADDDKDGVMLAPMVRSGARAWPCLG